MGGATADEEIHRGLQNLIGQNNCFLNSALQTLWHLPKFRAALNDFESPERENVSMIQLLPSLQTLFANFQYGESSVLPADEVRKVLSSLYSKEGRFAEGKIDDAVECLEALLVTIHCEAVGVREQDGGDEKICSPPCPACAVFKVAYFDMVTCGKCGATGDPLPQSDFVYRLWVDECLQGGPDSETLEACLRRIWESEATKGGTVKLKCPSPEGECSKSAQATPSRWCVQLPTCLTASLVWSSPTPPVQHIDHMLNKLRCSFDLGTVFTMPSAEHTSRNEVASYRFCGMICYYGLHYVSLFARRCQDKRSREYGQWLLFDDAKITVMKDWNTVKQFCIKAHYQPTVVWFERVPLGEAPWWDDTQDESYASQAMNASYSVLNGLVDGMSEGVNMLAVPLVSEGDTKHGKKPNEWTFEEGQGRTKYKEAKSEWTFEQGQGGNTNKVQAAQLRAEDKHNRDESAEAKVTKTEFKHSTEPTRGSGGGAEDKVTDSKHSNRIESSDKKGLVNSMLDGYGMPPMSTPPPAYSKTLFKDPEIGEEEPVDQSMDCEDSMQFPTLDVTGDPVPSNIPDRYNVVLNYSQKQPILRKRDVFAAHVGMGRERHCPGFKGSGFELVMHQGDIRIKGMDPTSVPASSSITAGDRLIRVNDLLLSCLSERVVKMRLDHAAQESFNKRQPMYLELERYKGNP